MKIDLVTIVWGHGYLDQFLKTCLPSQLSGENLSTLQEIEANFLIYTDEIGKEEISSSSIYKFLQKNCKHVEIRTLPPTNIDGKDPNRYKFITDILIDCLKSSQHNGRYFSWMIPDGVYPDGFFKALKLAAESEKKAIYGPGLRVEQTAFNAAFQSMLKTRQKGPSDVIENYEAYCQSSQELLRLGLPHIHPITRSLIKDSNPSSDFPSMIYLETDDGLIAKHFHLHPLLLWVDSKITLQIPGTFDSAGFLEQLQISEEDIELANTSDSNLWILEISSFDHPLALRTDDTPLDSRKIARWAQLSADQQQKEFFFKKNFYFLKGEKDVDYNAIERQTTDLYNEVIYKIDLRDIFIEEIKKIESLFIENRQLKHDLKLANVEISKLRAHMLESKKKITLRKILKFILKKLHL